MPREGISYHVDDVWRGRLRDRLTELGKSMNWLAGASGCPRSLLSEIMAGERHQTTYLPEIHAALSWPEPMGPLLSKDDEELLKLAHDLTDEQRARLHERALSMQEQTKKR